MPEWYLLIGVLALMSIIGIFRPIFPWASAVPVRIELLLLAAAALMLGVKAVRSAWHAPNGFASDGFAVRSITAVLFLLQPLARLGGRLRRGLTPWRRRGELAFAVPWPRRRTVWSNHWRSQTDRLLELEGDLRARCMSVVRGGDGDRWDIQVRVGPLGSARLRAAVEEHGQGRQLVRYRVWPRWSRALPPILGLLLVWFAGVITYDPYLAAFVGVLFLLVAARACREAGAGVAVVLRAIGGEIETFEARSESPDLMEDVQVKPGPPARNGSLARRQNGSHTHATPGSAEEALDRRR